MIWILQHRYRFLIGMIWYDMYDLAHAVTGRGQCYKMRMIFVLFPGLDLYDTDPAQHHTSIITAD